jgi:hypothetical protein
VRGVEVAQLLLDEERVQLDLVDRGVLARLLVEVLQVRTWKLHTPIVVIRPSSRSACIAFHASA